MTTDVEGTPGVVLPPGVGDSTRGFVARRWVLERVDRWLRESSERCLLITGEPGSGKTALAAWLAGSGPVPADTETATTLRRIRYDWDAAHFCIARGQRGTVNPSRFARLLAEQLARRHDAFAEAAMDRIAPTVNLRQEVRENWGTVINAQLDRLIVVVSDAEEIYNRAVREPLEELARARPDITVRILVDALDEAMTASEPNIVSLLAGSGDLPPTVRFLLTTRNDPKVFDPLDALPGKTLLDLSSDAYAPEVEADLRSYVSTRLAGATPPARGLSVEAAREELVRRADGNFLYTTWVLDELAAGRRSLEDVATLPQGLYGLYRALLDRLMPPGAQDFSTVWRGRHEPFFGLLTVATPVAPEKALRRWLDWDQGRLNAQVEDVAQVIEAVPDPVDGDPGWRLYHRSVAEFFAAERYRENGVFRPNRYHVDPERPHNLIAKHYLRRIRDIEDWAGDWTRCDTYGLRQLVGHLRARLELADSGRGALAEDLYGVALDPAFQAAQQEALSSTHALSDLRLVLEAALAEPGSRGLLPALRSVAASRSIIRGRSLSQGVFDAVAAGDLTRGLQRAEQYGAGGAWASVLRLYLAWEAASSGKADEARRAVAAARPLSSSLTSGLGDALLVRIAEMLAGPEGHARSQLSEFGRAHDADRLLEQYAVPPVPDRGLLQDVLTRIVAANVAGRYAVPPASGRGLLDTVFTKISKWSEELERARSPYGALPRLFIDGESVLESSPEAAEAAEAAWWLGRDLYRITWHPTGRSLFERVLTLLLRNPYPRYRDIALAALGTAALGSDDWSWVRRQLQVMTGAGLDDEGVTFTFDLPSAVLAERERRGGSASELADYLETALECRDAWGTRNRVLSARSGVLFRLGRVNEAFSALQEASGEATTTYAGYAVTAVLGLIDRCHEFGEPERARQPEWGRSGNETLLDLAAGFARRVNDPHFQTERLELVARHEAWTQEVPPNPGMVPGELSGLRDPDMRSAYLAHASARYAAPSIGRTASTWLKPLVPYTLFDATTSDLVLGRLTAVLAQELGEEELEEIIRVTTDKLTTGRPWALGFWR